VTLLLLSVLVVLFPRIRLVKIVLLQFTFFIAQGILLGFPDLFPVVVDVVFQFEV
jgi:hypothetical protein